jgi:ubiquinone/menaquinone biosynthesis C-methylase UbiE
MKMPHSCCGTTGSSSGKGNLDARIPQAEIAKVYDRVAFVYDIWGKLTESRARTRALQLAEIRDGQNILEVAVGTGLAFYEIVKRNPNGKNIGIDLSKGMLNKAAHRLRKLPRTNYSLCIGSALDLNIQDESIDVLMNNYMFDLISFADMDDALKEFKRVLKKGGRLILVNMTEGERPGSRLFDRLYTLSPKTMGGCRGVKLSTPLTQHGFRIEAREYFQQMLFPSEVILAYK